MGKKKRIQIAGDNVYIKCLSCGEARPLFESENKNSFYYRCRKCDILVFIYKTGLLAEKILKEKEEKEINSDIMII